VRRKVLGAALIAGVIAATAIPASADPVPDWQPCPNNGAEVQCATVPVPVDWRQPQGEQIDIAIARRPATDPAHRIGTLVHMPGGPGNTGVDRLQTESLFPPELQSRFDVVTYDPRGFGLSHPLRCDPAVVNDPPDVLPAGQRGFDALRDYNRRASDDCRARSGAIVDHMDNVSVAHDIDAIRAALGEQQLSLYGISYGTFAGQMYAERFPDRVRSMVLDGVFDHSQDTAGLFTSEAAFAEDAFNEFAAWCDRTAACVLHGQNIGALYDDLYARAEAGELIDPGTGAKVTPVRLASDTTGHLYSPSWSRLADRLVQLRDQPPVAATEAAEAVPDPMAAFCGDHRIDIPTAQRYAELWDQQAAQAPHLRMGTGATVATYCVGWNAPVQNPQHPLDIRTQAPILLLNSLHDPATGYGWAQRVAEQIPSGRLLTYDGWGHGAYGWSRCTLDAVHAALLDGTLPPPDTRCPAVDPEAPSAASSSGNPTAPW
jgi:pimeloyl-ACP methyl ester carboxylesterase